MNNVLYRSWLETTGEKAPIAVTIEPTIRCNMKCPMCDRTHKDDYKLHLDHEISTNALLDSIKTFGEIGVKQILIIGGGEPLLRKDIGIIIQNIRRYGIRCHLWTNGTLFTEQNIKEILPYVDIITISLDSAYAHEHDKSRGVEGSFLKIERSLSIIKKYRHEGLLLRFHCVISKFNYQNLLSLIDFAKLSGVKEIGGAVVNPFSFAPEEMLFNDEDKAAVSIIIEKFKEYATKQGVGLAGCFNQIFYSYSSELKSLYNIAPSAKTPTTCFGIWSMATIRPNGDVSICCFTYKPIIGNISDQNFLEVWNSHKATELRIKVKSGDFLDSSCKGCQLGAPILTDMVMQCPDSTELLDKFVINSR